MPTVTHANVSINSLRVIDSSVNTTSEPGSSAEWRLTFIVNGQASQWSSDVVKDNTVYPINAVFPNVPIGLQGMISIQVSGYEHDSTSANDPLPLLQVTTSPAEDFLLGGTRWSGVAQSDEGSYSIEYTIRPAISQPLVVARAYLAVFHTPAFNPRVLGVDVDVGGRRPFDRRRALRAAAAAAAGYSPLWAGTWNAFIAHWQAEAAAGRRLARLSTFRQDTGVYSFGDTTERVFLGTFEPGSDRYGLWIAPWQSFEAKWAEWSAQGLRLVDVATYEDGGEILFAGVFREGADSHALWVSDWNAFEAKWRSLSQSNLRLVSVDTFVESGTRKFAGAFREGADGYALWMGADLAGFKAKTAEFRSQGLHPVDVAAYADRGENRYVGTYRTAAGGSALFLGDVAELQAEVSARIARHARLVSVDTYLPAAEG